MTMFIGCNYIMFSSRAGDVILRADSTTVILRQSGNEITMMSTLMCIDLALQMIGA